MPTLGAPLDLAKYEAKNLRAHQLGTAPASPVTGQLYYNTADNTLYWWDGTAWNSAKGGVVPDATAAVKGVVQLTNDLGGTAAAPTVTNLHLAADTAVNHKLTAVTDPTGAQDAATKNYVDSQGTNNLSWKQLCRAVTQGVNITLSGTQTIDGVALNVGDRVLVNSQGSMPTNGIYIVQAGAWTRAPDMSTWAQTVGAVIPIGPEGSIYGGTEWYGPNTPGGTIGTTNLQLNTALPTSVGYGSFAGRQGVAIPSTATLNSIANANSTSAAWGNNNWRIVSLADPTGAQDAATKNYVDTVAQGLDAKQSCRAATTANIASLAGGAPNTLDGVALAVNDRVLVKDQTTTNQNGIYTVGTLGTGANGIWTRATDADAWTEFPGAFTWVEQGTTNADTGWICTVDQGGTLGTTAVTWTQFSGAAMITAGAGLSKSGNTLSALVDGLSIDLGGAGASIEIAAGGVTGGKIAAGAINLAGSTVTGTLPVANGGTNQTTAKAARETGLGAAGYYNNNATHGAGTTITITQATHLLRATRAIHVQVQDNATGNVELPDISVAANGDVTITYGAAVTANTKLVTLVG